MRPNDRQKFAAIVTGFAELKGKALSAAALDLYWAAMQHWSIEDFTAAASHLVSTCEFMPTPKNFEDLRKAGRPTPAEAWVKAVNHAASSAYRRGPTGDALLDKAVAAIGGYVAIAMHDEDTLFFLERRFAEAYEGMQDSEQVRAALPNIAGPTLLPVRNALPKLDG
jgi:hypothetical protein